MDPARIERRRGRIPLVLVAPHGGRRTRDRRAGDQLNDLHTADLARDLADRLDAHLVANREIDRNELDLHRVSELVDGGLPFLDALVSAIDLAGADGSVPLVAFVHGWNAVLPSCDLGAGLRRRGDRLTGRWPTLRRSTLSGLVAAIEDAFGARGLGTGLGLRYPASGSDNATQLLSGRHDGHDHPAVADLGRRARAGKIDGLQLELGIPLRWPGPTRDAALDALAGTLGRALASPGWSARTERAEWDLPPNVRRRDLGPPPGDGFELQTILDGGRAALFAGASATTPADMAARICLLRDDGTLALFVGEGPWTGTPGRYDLGPFGGSVGHGSLALRYDGPAMVHDHGAFVDLERGLVRGRLTDLAVELAGDPAPGGGPVRGRVRSGETTFVPAGTAFLEPTSRDGSRLDRLRIRALLPEGEALALSAPLEDLGRFDRPGDRARLPGGEADVIAAVPVDRTRGPVRVRVVFGIARWRPDGAGPVPAPLRLGPARLGGP